MKTGYFHFFLRARPKAAGASCGCATHPALQHTYRGGLCPLGEGLHPLSWSAPSADHGACEITKFLSYLAIERGVVSQVDAVR